MSSMCWSRWLGGSRLVVPGHRRRARRDDDGGRPPGLLARDRLVGRLAVIGTVRRDARDFALDLLEQVRYPTGAIGLVAGQDTGDDLARVGIESEMELAPGPAGPAMLLPATRPDRTTSGRYCRSAGAAAHAARHAVVGRQSRGRDGSRVVWSGMLSSTPRSRSTLPTKPSAWRRASWKTSRSVSTSSIARSE